MFIVWVIFIIILTGNLFFSQKKDQTIEEVLQEKKEIYLNQIKRS